jgi:phospholipase C
MKPVVCTLALLILSSYAVAQHDRERQGKHFNHVLILFQENRTTDNLFHDPVLIKNGADIAETGRNSKGQNIPLRPVGLVSDYDMKHSHEAFVEMYDGGKMDGADKIEVTCNKGTKKCPPPNAQFRYVNPSDVQPYFQLAEQYVLGDHMFQTNQGPSFPAHQYIISGTSAPTVNSPLFAAENPMGIFNTGSATGCTAPSDEFVWMIDPEGNESSKQYPCFEHPALTDLLDRADLKWAYYTPQVNTIWTGPNAIAHIRFGKDWHNVVQNPKKVFAAITNHQLGAVTWVMPPGYASDHAGENNGTGPSWVASIVNAIGISNYWDDTAIIVTWDDWGGWYDHVAPSIVNSYEYGFRVPLLVIAKSAKRGHISHVTHDFGSILKFIESNWDLPSLGYADQYADDLSDCFDFDNPHEFVKIRAPYDAQYFLKSRRPLGAPDND